MNYAKLFSQLKRHEGLRLSAYKCSAGYWTIGYGRNLETNGLSTSEQFALLGEGYLTNQEVIDRLKASTITEEQADILFQNDLANVEENCYQAFCFSGHSDARRAVIINMVFQMGLKGVLNFTNTLKAFDAKNYDECADQMLDSKWFKRDTPSRAQELADQMRSGEWQ